MSSDTAIRGPIRGDQSLADICSLSPEQLSERLAMVKREIRPHLLRRLKLENGLAFEFEANPEMQAKLEGLAALERQCCSTLDFEVRRASDTNTLFLEILGADPNTGAFDGLSLDPPNGPPATASGLWRFARTGGVAAALSFLLFCVVPLAIVSLAGAAFAAPLLKLDNPWVVGAGALVLGIGLWQFEKRLHARKRKPAAAGPAGDCGC